LEDVAIFNGFVPEIRKSAPIVNKILVEDVICGFRTTAGWVVIGGHNNSWLEWKDKDGKPIDICRKNE
jgi:hypothetical protein